MYVPGTFLMWLALLAGVASVVSYWLSIRQPERWRLPARQMYLLMTAAVVVASGLLMYLLVTHDYRLHYVWAYSDNLLPLHYLISTFWGGQEGSFLLWIFWGVLLGLPLMRFARAYESTEAKSVTSIALDRLSNLLAGCRRGDNCCEAWRGRAVSQTEG